MNQYPGMKLGAMLLLLTAILLFAGCTQPSTVPASTSTPTATTVPPTATLTPVADNQTLKTTLSALAGEYAQEVDRQAVATAMKEGPNSTAFATVLGQLKALKARDSRIMYVYTLAQKNGSVWFIVDANYGLPDGSDYMDEYTDAAAELRSPVTAPIGVGPYTDQWGTFYSGYAPVDIGSNETVVLMGVDVRA